MPRLASPWFPIPIAGLAVALRLSGRPAAPPADPQARLQQARACQREDQLVDAEPLHSNSTLGRWTEAQFLRLSRAARAAGQQTLARRSLDLCLRAWQPVRQGTWLEGPKGPPSSASQSKGGN